MSNYFSQKSPLNTDDSSSDIYQETAELVTAVKELNRSVTSLNRALLRLQQKIANQTTSLDADEAEVKILH